MDAAKNETQRSGSLRLPSIPSFNDFNSFTFEDHKPELDRAWSINSDRGNKPQTPMRSMLERVFFEHARHG